MFFSASRRALLAASAGLIAASAARGQPVPVTPPTIGSANTATADPPVPRPRSTPCRVRLFTDVKFADFSPKSFAYVPAAACPGPWRQVVLEADFSVEGGRQFDRTATLWIGGVNIYFGTTAEPTRKTAAGPAIGRAWHVERDLTEYAALLTAPAAGRAELGNLVNGTYTSSLWGTAELAFYPRDEYGDDDARRTADVVLPLSGGPTGGTVALFRPSDALTAAFTLPTNVERAFLDVVLQHQGANDEFWYGCVPDKWAAPLQDSCVGTAFREGEVRLDGQPAGVVPIYPWIFTGGIDPYLWRPIPAVQALNFIPYRVDLTPFAGVLSDGQPHRLAINVFNNSQYFSTTATLLLYLDRGSKRVTGRVTRNTLGAAPTPVLQDGLTTAKDGTVSGNLTIFSLRHFVIEGWVQTSHGKVQTEVSNRIDFTNSQDFVSPQVLPLAFVQNIKQLTTISSVTKIRAGERSREIATRMSWPLEADMTVYLDAAGGFSQVASIRQAYDRSDTVSREGEVKFHSVVSNSGAWANEYPSTKGQAGSQRYFSADSEGACYARSIKAAKGVLTGITDGADCGD